MNQTQHIRQTQPVAPLPYSYLLADPGVSSALRRDIARAMARRTQTLTLEDPNEFFERKRSR